MWRVRLAAVFAVLAACSTTTWHTFPASGGLRPRCDSWRTLALELKLPVAHEDRVVSEHFPASEISSLHFRRESRWASPGPQGTQRSPMLRIRLADEAARRVAELEPHLWEVREVEGLGPVRVRAHYALSLLADGAPVLEDGGLRVARGVATADFVRADVDFDRFLQETWRDLGCR